MMLRPEIVAECCAAMQAAVSIPVTVKCRLGVPWPSDPCCVMRCKLAVCCARCRQ